jgi:hypothetical protein
MAALSSSSTGPAAAILAHRRQRGEGSDPVGVSSSTNPASEIQIRKIPKETPARYRAPGSDPGRTTSP